MSSFFTADFVALVIRVGTPLMFCSMSAYVAALAGIPNIAVEGIMLFGALFGVYFSALFSSAWLGLLGVIGVGVVLALVLAFFTMKMKADPISAYGFCLYGPDQRERQLTFRPRCFRR